MNKTLTALPDDLFAQLQKEKLVLLATVDAETGGPAMNAISWVYAVDPATIRFAIDARSRIVANLAAQPRVALTFFGSGSVHSCIGSVRVVAEALEDVPFKMVCYDLKIESVRNTMFYGARIIAEPEYEKTYDKRAAERLDNQVYAAMKKA